MAKGRYNHRLQLAIAAILFNAGVSAAYAETSTAVLEEIVVTAQKRVEDLQKVAISATVLSTSELRVKGVQTLQDLTNVTPGLSIQPQTTGESFINIRGVGVQATSPTSSNGVAFYVDSQYIPDNFTNIFSLYDIASVEVLRGPQGTLVGENATGGAILVTSAQPEQNKSAGYYTQTIGNFNETKEEGALNIPVTETLAARVAFVDETRDSFTTNLGNGSSAVPNNLNQPGNVNTQALRLQAAWQPTADFQATLRLERFQSRTDGAAIKPLASAVTDPVSASIQNSPYLISYDTPQYFNVVGDRASAEVKYNVFSGAQLRSVTSVQDGHEEDQDDIDFGLDTGHNILVRRTDVHTFTQELNLVSTDSGPLQWVAGLYYLHTTTPLVLTFTAATAPLPLFSSPFGIAEHTNEAVFAQATYNFLSNLSVTLGGRYTKDDSPYNAVSNILTPGGPVHISTSTDPTSSEPTGKGAINWNVTDDTMLYASIANGYKAGGGNLAAPPYKPETNVVDELGIKTTLLDRRLRIDADVFSSRYSQIQLQQFVGGGPATTNAASAKINGAEAEVLGVFGGFRADIGASYLHGYFDAPFVYVTTPISSGTETPYTPQWLINAGIQYEANAWGGTLTPRLQYSYSASQTTVPTPPVPLTNLPSHGIADFRLMYETKENWRIEAYVTNLTDKVYVANTVDIGIGPGGFAYSAPRQFGVRFGYRWSSEK